MNDDVTFLREILSSHDPAQSTRLPAAPALANADRRLRSARSARGMRLDAAAVIGAVTATVLVLTGQVVVGRVLTSDNSVDAARGPAAATTGEPTASTAGPFDHVRSREFGPMGNTITDRWVNSSGYGRLFVRNSSGAVLVDVRLMPPPDAASASGSLPAQASPIATAPGTLRVEAVEFAGEPPATPELMRAYLDETGTRSEAELGQRALTLLLTRHLDDAQAAALAEVCRGFGEIRGSAVTPTGQHVGLRRVDGDSGLPPTTLLIAGDGRLVGESGKLNGQATWRIVTASTETSQTQPRETS